MALLVILCPIGHGTPPFNSFSQGNISESGPGSIVEYSHAFSTRSIDCTYMADKQTDS